MKKWYQSKTNWYFITVGIVGIIQTNQNLLEGNLGEYYGYFVIVNSVIGFMLRSVTNTGIEKKAI